MTSEDYRSALAAAIKEYETLGERRREIDNRLAQLAQTIGTLSRLLGLTPTVPMSITDAVRPGAPSGDVGDAVREAVHAVCLRDGGSTTTPRSSTRSR